MQPFFSTVVNRLDAKGRVSVPAAFRQVLSQENLQGFYCVPSFHASCIEAFGGEMLAQTQASLAKYHPLYDSEYDDEAATVLARTQFLKYDDEGRVSLPSELLDHIGKSESLCFVGMGAKFQIWNPAKYEEDQRQRIERSRLRRSKGSAS